MLDKRELLRLVQGDAKAVERWFKTYADAVYNFVYYRIGRDAELAEDIVQGTFTGALEKIKQYDPEKGHMFAWLTYLSRNHIHKALRTRGRFLSYDQICQDADSDFLKTLGQIADEPLPDEIIQQKEMTELVQMTIVNIPTNHKEVLVDYYYRRKSIKEIADNKGVSEGAIKALLHRGRKSFKAAFLNRCKSLSDPETIEGTNDE